MRSMIALTILAAALVAGGCKKSEKPAADPAPAKVEPKGAEPAPKATEVAPTPDLVAPPVADTSPLKLKSTPAVVGDKRTKTDDMQVDFQFDKGGTKIDATSVEHKEERIETLQVDGNVATKIKVIYGALTAMRRMGGKDQAKPQVLAGKSYLVWVEGGAIKATTADGAAVSADELKELADKNDELGKPDVLENLMSARTWKIGEPYALSADELAKLKAHINNPDKPAPSEMSFTLLSFDAKEAQFAMTTTLVQGKGDEVLTFAMKGVLRLGLATGRPLEMTMSGGLTGTMQTMPTTGTLTSKTLYSY